MSRRRIDEVVVNAELDRLATEASAPGENPVPETFMVMPPARLLQMGMEGLVLLQTAPAPVVVRCRVVAVAAGLMLRRHMRLPTVDGRVPLIGLDREFSLEALERYQALKSSGPVYQALREPSVLQSAKRLEVVKDD